jgi:ABC-type sulfate transport system permease component
MMKQIKDLLPLNRKRSVKIKSKKGVQMTMQMIVVIIILLILLAFLIIFFTGQGDKLTTIWNSMVSDSITQTKQSVGP